MPLYGEKKRILIDTEIEPSGEYDIFNKTDNNLWLQIVKSQYNGYCFNTGNKLWFQGIISEVDTDENELTYYRAEMSHDYINNNFDMILAPMANIFSVEFYSLMDRVADSFEKYKIPIYVVACGVQAKNYDSLDDLISEIRIPAVRLIKAVYKSGGEFALRGYFTKEFFDRLGFSSAVVTGCPSLYQLGEELPAIILKNIYTSPKTFKLALNGNLKDYAGEVMQKYKNSVFFDQGHYFSLLNDPCSLPEKYDIKTLFIFYKRIYGEEVLLEDRVKLFPDMDDWYNFLRFEKFTFSFGERIHGNIMALLAGVPAMVYAQDSRTMEMAEFFDIPIYKKKELPSNFEEVYTKLDYGKFAKNFAKKFDNYEQFLIDHRIVKKINKNNHFFDNNEVVELHTNEKQLQVLKEKLDNKKPVLKMLDHIYKIIH